MPVPQGNGEHDAQRQARDAWASLGETPRNPRRRARGPTFRQLYREARRRGIAGRSHMTKEELERVLGVR